MQHDTPTIWVLADDRAGNRAQCIGIAERLGLPYEIQEIHYTALARLPNILRASTLLGVETPLKAPWPDIVIAAGRRTAPVARFIKRKSKGKTKLVQCMWPDAGISQFDCIVLPEHDRARKTRKNILSVTGAPHPVTSKALTRAAQKWQNRFASLPVPRLAVLVGGSTRHGTFDESDFHRLGVLAATTARMHHAGVLVTTSRRTGQEGERVLMSHLLNLPHHLYGRHHFTQDNPYLGYLALADAIIVTADSIAMCSEACATGKPVYLFQPKNLSNKHQRFAENLIKSGHARILREDTLTEWFSPLCGNTLDSAAQVARFIQNRWMAH